MFTIFVATIVGQIPSRCHWDDLSRFHGDGAGRSGTNEGALTAFSNSSAWLIAMAFMLSRGFIKTGLGRRIALVFVRSLVTGVWG